VHRLLSGPQNARARLRSSLRRRNHAGIRGTHAATCAVIFMALGERCGGRSNMLALCAEWRGCVLRRESRHSVRRTCFAPCEISPLESGAPRVWIESNAGSSLGSAERGHRLPESWLGHPNLSGPKLWPGPKCIRTLDAPWSIDSQKF